MRSKITDKFQTTIPRQIRAQMKVSKNDILEWKLEEGKVVVETAKKPFLSYKGVIRVGKGDIRKDIQRAKELLGKRIHDKDSDR